MTEAYAPFPHRAPPLIPRFPHRRTPPTIGAVTHRQTDSLTEALSLSPHGEGQFLADVPDGWQQGRGAYGGLVLGLLAEAMDRTAAAETDRRMRTLSGELVAPVLPGEALLRVFTVRRGAGISSLRAELSQGGVIAAHAHALFGRDRVEGRDRVDLAPPPPPDLWRELEVLPVEPPIGPQFARHFEFRTTGPLPFSQPPVPEAAGFVRAHRPPEQHSAATVIAHADAWWPTGFAAEEAPRPMATVSFNLQLFEDPALLPAQTPFFHRSRMLGSRGGYFLEVRELWTADGRLAALNPQTFAIIK